MVVPACGTAGVAGTGLMGVNAWVGFPAGPESNFRALDIGRFEGKRLAGHNDLNFGGASAGESAFDLAAVQHRYDNRL